MVLQYHSECNEKTPGGSPIAIARSPSAEGLSTFCLNAESISVCGPQYDTAVSLKEGFPSVPGSLLHASSSFDDNYYLFAMT